MNRLLCWAALAGAVFILSSCDSSKPEAARSHRSPAAESPFGAETDITALADGGAYIRSDGHIWYARGGEAVLLKVVPELASPNKKMSANGAGWARAEGFRKHLVRAEGTLSEYEADETEREAESHER